MRITVVSPHWPSPASPMRGVQTSAQLRLFAERSHQVRAVVPVPRSLARPLPREERDGETLVTHPRYLRLPRAESSVALLFERRSFAGAASRDLASPDVVLAQSATLPGGLLGRVGRAAFVVTLHDHELFELAPRRPLLRRAIAATLRGADCAVYVSDALRARGTALAGPHRASVIPIGIDTFPDLAARRPDRFVVSCVTRLIRRKGVDRLLRAFARLATDAPDARMVVVGDGPERAALEDLAHALGLASRVEFTGLLDRRAALERVARSSVMALPSVLESLGAAYLEAMSLGVAVLGTRGEGIAAYVEHGVDGLLVPAGDDEALYAELQALAVDPDRCRRLGEAGRRRFREQGPTWEANVTAHLDLFTELLRTRTRRAPDLARARVGG